MVLKNILLILIWKSVFVWNEIFYIKVSNVLLFLGGSQLKYVVYSSPNVGHVWVTHVFLLYFIFFEKYV
jgi:hypothetical protein